MPNVKLLQVTPNYMELTRKAMGECYQRGVGEKTVKRAIKSGHLSVLEHCTATFEVTCSTSVLLQLTRHRHLSFTVQSSRGSELTTIYKTGRPDLDKYIEQAMINYKDILDSGVKPQDAAYLLPKAAEYTFVVTGNLRSWYEYLPKRMCKRAMPEHQELAKMIQKELAKTVPEIFDRDFMNCNNCHERGCEF